MADNIVGTKIVIDSTQAIESVGSIKTQLREANAELIEMADKFGMGSEQAANAASKVAELRDKIGDARSFADAFNPDAKFRAFSQSLQGVASGFAAVQGAMAVFGVKSEDLQQTLLKVQGALALSEGLNTFLDTGIQGFKNLANVIKSTFLTLKAEIGATGIGALVIALGAAVGLLVNNFDELNGVTDEAAKKNKAYADTLNDTNQATTKAIENVNTVKQAFDAAKQGVISKKDALNIYNDTLGESLGKTDNLAVAEKNLNLKADAYVKATMLKAQANAMFALSAKLQAEDLTTGQKDNVSWWEKSLAAVNSFFTNGLLSYKTSVATYQAVNTQEIKNGLQKQKDIVDKEGQKLLKDSENLQKQFGIKLDVKEKDDSAVKKEKTKQEKLKELLDQYKKDNKKRDEDQLNDLIGQYWKDVEENKKALDQQVKDEDAAATETLNIQIRTVKIREGYKKREQDLEKARFEESLKWATMYAESAQSLSDALYGAKLAGVEKGSREEQAILLKQFETNKKIQIAQTIISGLNGVVNALSAKSVLPEPFGAIARGVNAGMIGATTALNVAKIAQTQFGGTTANMSAASGGSAPMSPTVPIQQTVTQLNQGTINALGNQAIKAYVLESDVTNSQGRVTRILNSSRFK